MKELQQLFEPFNLHHPFMFKVFMHLQLPGDMKRNVHGLGAYGQGWGDVTLERITHHEQFLRLDVQVTTQLQEDIASMAVEYECSPEEMFLKIKSMYDGYHFSEISPDIYNPFSLLNALDDKKIKPGWFATGTPTYLIRQMQHFHTNIAEIDRLEVPAEEFDVPTEAMTTALPLLYQSGYLTIKGYERLGDIYRLEIPNQEVRIGFTRGLMPTYIGIDSGHVQVGFALKFWRALLKRDLDLALREMQAYLAGIPYVEGFKKKLEEAATKEGFYEYTLYLIFSMLNVYVRTQVKVAGGRVDMVVLMPDTTYVLELKMNGTAQEALEQINTHSYALPYETDGRRVVKAGISFSLDTRTVGEWVIADC